MMMAPTLTSVTAIVLVREDLTIIKDISRLSETLAVYFTDVETVLVANGVPPEWVVDLARIVETVPDCTVIFLNDEVHDDIARLLGIDHAISDYILFCTPLSSEIDALPKMLAAVAEGHDLAIGDANYGIAVERGAGSALMFWMFRTIYRLMSGWTYERDPPKFRLFGRAAALYIALRSDGEVRIRARSLGQGFSVATIDVPAGPKMTGRAPFKKSVSKSLRLILTGSTFPLRATSYFGMLGGVGSLLYGIYIVFIYLFKTDVAPGWTTLSIQLASMMFLFSIQFVFLSEYLIQILNAAPAASRRHLVARELRGSLSRRSARLNIVDREGRYQIGAPASLLSQQRKA
jgi:polyisoprenyl-phosphate glycosyltransferase